jgi:hypothetical protein
LSYEKVLETIKKTGKTVKAGEADGISMSVWGSRRVILTHTSAVLFTKGYLLQDVNTIFFTPSPDGGRTFKLYINSFFGR